MTRPAPALALLAIAAVAIVAASPFLGSSPIHIGRIFDASLPREANPDAVLFFDLRLPRALFGAAVGAALALAGALMQAVLRNDLASPFTMGISSGAALGALASIHAFGLATSYSAVPALLGALATMAAVLLLARRMSTWESAPSLLLAGVSLNLLLGAAILVVQYLANPFETFAMMRWMMGALDVTSHVPSLLTGTATVVGLLLAVGRGRDLNALQLGDASAHALGVDARRLRLSALGLASLLTAIAVAHAGPIGFVGLLVPNAIRRAISADYRIVLAGSALAGAGFLVLCDTLARAAARDLEIPVGIITSLVGGPAFLYILATARHR